ncbi:hemerythrin domain-containing protein [Pontibacter roseus]|uniref:hemerythrin domain-containing protein n=1 Tax=Pontibacter roseus TaxID=336989 RepID=UPI00036DCD25|nr:hemerythrin domain-containing protein [Pontibacter roseus]
MKRHDSLIPLSRQHHGGLLTARLLQHGAPPYKGMPESVDGKLAYLLQFWEEHLQPHFTLEEATVFKTAKVAAPHLARQAEGLEAEHRQLKQLILSLPTALTPELPTRLDEIGRLLEQHIRTEERIFFQMLQEELPEETLQLLKEQIEQHLL